MMTDIDAHRQRLHDLIAELNDIGPAPPNVAEFPIAANAVRQNEYLIRRNRIQSEIIDVYNQYVEFLEESSSSLLKINSKMLDIIKIQIANNT